MPVATVRQNFAAGTDIGFFAGACNAGAAAAGGSDYLVFLNNDTIPLAGWLDALVAEAESDESVAAVGARLLYPNGQVQHAGVVIGQDGWPHHLYAGFPGEHPAVTRKKDITAVTAACLLVRRSEFAALGGHPMTFRPDELGIDTREPAGDVAHILSGYCAVLGARQVGDRRRRGI